MGENQASLVVECMTPTNAQILAGAKRERIEKAKNSLMDFVLYTKQDYESGWFNELLCLEMDKFLRDVESGKMPRLMIFAPPRSGKLLADETLVPTPGGYVTHGSLKPGDLVYGSDGHPVRVLATSEKAPANVRVELTSGEVFYCHEDHEWTVYDRPKRSWETYEARHFTRQTKFGNPVRLLHGEEGSRGCHYVYNMPICPALSGEKQILDMPPYVLGAWLGDGTRVAPRITHARNETEVISAIQSFGYAVTSSYAHEKTGVITTNFSGSVGVAGRMSRELDELGLLNRKGRFRPKLIPEKYLLSTIEDRLDLLAGLIDTDGHIDSKGRMVFTSSERELIDSVLRLIESLGWRPYETRHEPRLSTSGIQGRKVYWTVGFQPTFYVPCRLKRKQPTRFAAQRRESIKRVSIDPCGKIGNCIQVDSEDGLYVIGKKLTLTHNSEIASRRFPAFALGKHPNWNVISCSYSSDLSNRMSRDTQRIIDDERYRDVFPQTCLSGSNVRTVAKGAIRTAELWETVSPDGSLHGGAYRSAGVNGGITGQGMHIGIIDDPAKDFKTASSAVYQESVMDWYDTTFFTRADPKLNGIVIILTRWHQLDLAGQLLKKAEDGGEQWRVVSFPMEAEKVEIHEIEGVKYKLRDPGQILFPERMPQDFVDKCKQRGGLVWNALYQQRPTSKGGGLIKSAWINYYQVLPKILWRAVYADTASKTEEHNDFSVFQCWGMGADGNCYMIDQLRGKWEGWELEIKAAAFWAKHQVWHDQYNPAALRYLAVEDKSSGTGLIQVIKNKSSAPVKAIQRDRDKLSRLFDVQGFIESGYIYLPDPSCNHQYTDPSWVSDFLIEAESFSAEMTHAHDDQLDPMIDAISDMKLAPGQDFFSGGWI